MSPALNRICVYCASNNGNDPVYREAARSFGRVLAKRGTEIVYGGGKSGLMGALADAALAEGGKVTGVIPHALVEREVAHEGLTSLHIVDSMHERKALLSELSDAFVALPGGLGTLEELFEAWTWAQLGVHQKPVGLLDVNSFWAPFQNMILHLESEGFLRGAPRNWLVQHRDPTELIGLLECFQPPEAPRWLSAADIIRRNEPADDETAGRQERELYALQSIGRFVARVAHEINNPLAGIQNAFLLVRDAIPADHPYHRFVTAIDREIARIASVTREMTEIYRPDESNNSGCSVVVALRDALACARGVVAQDIPIDLDDARAPSRVALPDAVMRQTLYSVIAVLHHTLTPGGTISIAIFTCDDQCIVQVCNGRTANAGEAGSTPFNSADETNPNLRDRVELSLARHTLEAWRGSIETRDCDGGGVEIEVRLPLMPGVRGETT